MKFYQRNPDVNNICAYLHVIIIPPRMVGIIGGCVTGSRGLWPSILEANTGQVKPTNFGGYSPLLFLQYSYKIRVVYKMQPLKFHP